jgi:hypothetical protein
MGRCLAQVGDHSTVQVQEPPSCHHSQRQMREVPDCQMKFSGLRLCCLGSAGSPPAVSTQRMLDHGVYPDPSTAESVVNDACSVCLRSLVAAHSGEPPPQHESRAIYQLNCDLRI